MANEQIIESKEFQNSLTDFCGMLALNNQLGGAQLSQTDTMSFNLRNYLVSNNRQLLNQVYVEHGIVQTLVDQPVDDAFSPGFEIKTGQLDAEQIEDLEYYCKKHRVIQTIAQGGKWARLFGGGGVLVNTDQNPALPLSIGSLRDKSRLEFVDFDMWEMSYSKPVKAGETIVTDPPDFFYYNGIKMHKSRVFPISGKKAPSLVRPRLFGWGMSELERLVRSFNQYLKNQDVIFALLDEAKIDVYKITGFNSSLLTTNGSNGAAKRIQTGNAIKNFTNAIVMDSTDDYSQKQMTFTGLAEMLKEIRIQVASDLKMPVTKLFGISSAGFNSGEDDIENYNSMVESEVRSKIEFIVIDVLQIICQKLFGFVPDDLRIKFKSLRILSAVEEEKVKDSQFNRVMSTFQSGLGETKEIKESINKASLLPVEIDENLEALPPVEVPEDFTVSSTNINR